MFLGEALGDAIPCSGIEALWGFSSELPVLEVSPAGVGSVALSCSADLRGNSWTHHQTRHRAPGAVCWCIRTTWFPIQLQLLCVHSQLWSKNGSMKAALPSSGNAAAFPLLTWWGHSIHPTALFCVPSLLCTPCSLSLTP